MSTIQTATPASESSPALEARTLCEAFELTSLAYGGDVALRTVGGGIEITWEQYARRVERLAAGVAALGVRRGETVGVLLTNRPEFHLVDTAVLHVGATPFSLHPSARIDETAGAIADAGAAVVVTESEFFDRVLAAQEAGAPVAEIVLIDGDDGRAIPLAELEAATRDHLGSVGGSGLVRETDTATIVFDPRRRRSRGVRVQHRHVIAMWRALSQLLPVAAGGRLVSFPAPAEITYRQAGHYLSLLTGAAVTTVRHPRELAAALTEVRPTMIWAEPHVLEEIRLTIEAARFDRGNGSTGVLARLGLEQASWVLSSRGAISAPARDLYAAVGLPVVEGWGIPETCGLATINPPGRIRAGTAGVPLPGVECRVADGGELLVRGRSIAADLASERDGPGRKPSEAWLSTGERALIDADGYVRLLGRDRR